MTWVQIQVVIQLIWFGHVKVLASFANFYIIQAVHDIPNAIV